jgi:hypothetical protein
MDSVLVLPEVYLMTLGKSLPSLSAGIVQIFQAEEHSAKPV